MSGLGGVSYGSFDSPVGEVFVAASPAGICRVSYGMCEAAWVRELEDTYGHVEAAEPPVLAGARAQLEGYFEGTRRVFELPLDLSRQSPFQQRILRVVEQIPWGSVLSYGEVAEEAGLRGAARAVGGVMRANPVPILVPCHRVVRSGGQLGGFMGGSQQGIAYKARLLRLEGMEVESVPGPGARLRQSSLILNL